MGLVSFIIAACTGASSNWARQKQTSHQLGNVASLSLPAKFFSRNDEDEQTPDYSSHYYRKTNDTHINGQTSYAEEMTVTVVAPDLPPDRFDRLLATGELAGFGRNPGLGEADADGRRWLVREVVYERHPVTEPSWQVRVDDQKRGLVIQWRGFRKHYTLEQAKTNLTELLASITISPALADDFAKRRSWARSGWEAAFAANSAAAKTVLGEFKLELPASGAMTQSGKWRLYLDDLRPQQLHIVHELAALTLPDGPFRIIKPVTYFKYMQQRWVQENQGQESDKLPEGGKKLISSDLRDTTKIYFYQMTAIDMWKTYAGDEFAPELRKTLRSMIAKHEALLKDGFIAGDAEP